MFRTLMMTTARNRLFNAAGEGAPGAGDPGATPPAGAPPAPAPAPAAGAKWFEGAAFSAEDRAWLTAKGLAEDDPMAALPKAIKGHRNAEQRLGKGVDAIMDRPAKDQPLAEFLRANAATLGLPDKEDAYAVTPPDSWPKDVAWDTDFESKARKIAFDNGLHPDAHKAFVGLYVEKMQNLMAGADAELSSARSAAMADLQKEWGQATDQNITIARQAAQTWAEEAGLSAAQLSEVGKLLGKAGGDASTIKLFAAIGRAMGEDKGVAMNTQGGLTMTAAEARAELAKFTAPDGDYGKAFRANDHRALAALKPRREQLSRIAAGG